MSTTYMPGKVLREAQAFPTVLCNPTSKASNQFYGRTGLSGVSAVVSTTVIRGDSIVALTLQANGISSAQAPWTPGVLSVSSGVSFTIGAIGSVSMSCSYTAHWQIWLRA
jgi:hypothetical protein